MSAEIVFRRLAQIEFDEAVVWYDEQQPGLGIDFVDEVQKVLDVISGQPNRYPQVFGDVREALVHRFPFAIYYRVKPTYIVVIAMFHCSRDPENWRNRSFD